MYFYRRCMRSTVSVLCMDVVLMKYGFAHAQPA